MSTAAPHIPAYTSLVLSGVRGAADQREREAMRGKIRKAKRGQKVLDTPLTPDSPRSVTGKEGALVSIRREVSSCGEAPAQVIPISAPTRADLWSRHQLALSVLQHGRVDAQEVIAILSGASIEDLLAAKRVS